MLARSRPGSARRSGRHLVRGRVGVGVRVRARARARARVRVGVRVRVRVRVRVSSMSFWRTLWSLRPLSRCVSRLGLG